MPLGPGPTNHPALKDLNLGDLGGYSPGQPVLTKSLLYVFTGNRFFLGFDPHMKNDFNLRAIDKKTGETVHTMELGIDFLGVPMTYAVDGRQYIALATLSKGVSEVIALSLPE
jgi:quinoprotein glucose dehydrogenase